MSSRYWGSEDLADVEAVLEGASEIGDTVTDDWGAETVRTCRADLWRTPTAYAANDDFKSLKLMRK
jgi:hypothetical protein